MKQWFALSVLSLILLATSSPALAANPACGSFISGAVTLTAPMVCSGTALHLNSNATLDCAGFTISGPDPLPVSCNPQIAGCVTNHYGIQAFNVTNLTITRCTVNGFERGLYLLDVTNSRVTNNVFRLNTRYGGQLSGASSGNIFTGNTYEQNRDEGLHLSDLVSGPTTTSSSSPGSVGADWTIEGGGDFNGDGKADILWRHSSGQIYIWLMNGSNIIGTGSPGGVGLEWTIQGVGDFNGDGKADVLWRHSGGLIYIWLLNGTAISSTSSPGGVGPEWTVHGIGDFDGNGKADILWRHSGGPISTWFMDGANSFSGERAVQNAAEGFYLLNADGVQFTECVTQANGAPGFYVKNSQGVSITKCTLLSDNAQILDESGTLIIKSLVTGP